MKILAINTQVFAVHRRYIKERLNGGKIYVCKIQSYENLGGRILPILKSTQTKQEISAKNYRIFSKLEDAIVAITTKNR